jgi:hypothetical protein
LVAPDESPRGRKLIGDLTVEDARHILHTEGGELSGWEIASRIVSVAAVSALTARAIVIGDATVWHLALPMVAQWLAIILAIPVLYVVTPHPEMRKDALKAVRLLVGIVLAVVIAVAARSWYLGAPWRELLAADVHTAWNWIANAHMQWPILLAFVGELVAMPGRVRNVFEYGPPFVSVSLGCAMRLVVLMFGVFVLPWFIGGGTNMAWFLWWLILIAEVLTLWMHIDLQRSLRRLSAQGGKIAAPPKSDGGA